MKTKQINTRLPIGLLEKVDDYRYKNRIGTTSEVIRLALLELIKRDNEPVGE